MIADGHDWQRIAGDDPEDWAMWQCARCGHKLTFWNGPPPPDQKVFGDGRRTCGEEVVRQVLDE